MKTDAELRLRFVYRLLAGSVICFGTVSITDVGLWVVNDKGLEAVSVSYWWSTFLG